MRKLTPLFLVMFAFFLLALATSGSYERARATKSPVPDQLILLSSDHATPAVAVMKSGSVVDFVPQDGLIHRIASASGALTRTDSGDIQPGGSYELTFTGAGSYDFVDTLHTQTHIKIVIYDPTK